MSEREMGFYDGMVVGAIFGSLAVLLILKEWL